MYNIKFINSTTPTVLQIEVSQFETQYADKLRGCDNDDIGGLIVYSRAGDVAAVLDYENECAWVV